MARPPRTPRPIRRSADSTAETVASRPVVRLLDTRQADLFATAFVAPCKPTLRLEVPVGPRWQYEIKHDGYRSQCHVNSGLARIFTKSGLDWAERMPGIRKALEALPVESAVIDGEAVMVAEDGVTDFFALHGALARKRAPHAFLYAFDLLHLDGEDLRREPLHIRRQLLRELLAGAPHALTFSEHMTEDGPEILKAACGMGLEGIVAKRVDAPYRSGRSEAWLKIKCTKTAMFAVTGYDPAGRTGVRSLMIAELENGHLSPVGSVGSGLTDAASAAIRTLLDAGAPVVIEVEFRGRTPSGGLRHPVFLGFVG